MEDVGCIKHAMEWGVGVALFIRKSPDFPKHFAISSQPLLAGFKLPMHQVKWKVQICKLKAKCFESVHVNHFLPHK